MKRILIVDDDRGSRESLRQVFSKIHSVTLAENAREALKILESKPVDIVLLDVMMPEKDGISLLKELHDLYPELPCVMVSASASVRPVVEAMKAGAYDFVVKPFDVEELRRIVFRVLETSVLRRRVEALQGEVEREFPVHGLVGQSPAFLKALDDVAKAAETDATVLIQGESGTGKELIARRLHTLSPRHDEPFIPIHCAALPETLLESELFGHEKGAFTGADCRKPGRFDLAGSGTLFFDEIGEMSLSTQVKLLRVLQEREYMRLGGTQVIRANARIVAATARDLSEEVRQRKFRDDLYYRLNVIPIRLPSLRERPNDVPLLALHFLASFRRSMPINAGDFSPEAMDILRHYSWPGNVREMRNLVERTLVLNPGETIIEPKHLPESLRQTNPGPLSVPEINPAMTLSESVCAFERRIILDALRRTQGVQSRAATFLGTTRRILAYRMRRMNIRASEIEQVASPPVAPSVRSGIAVIISIILAVSAGCRRDPLQRAINAIERNNPALAESLLDGMASSTPDDPSVLGNLAIARLKLSQTDAALAGFRRAADLAPADPRPLEFMADIAANDGRWRMCLELLMEAERRDPQSPRLQTALALAELKTCGPQPARARLVRVLGVAPNYSPAIFNLAAVMKDYLNSPAEAVPLLERFLSISGDAAAKDIARQSLAQLRSASTTPPRLPSSNTTAPSLQDTQPKTPSRTVPIPSTTVSSHPPAAIESYNSGVRNQAAGNLSRAIQDYHAALDIDHGMPSAHYNLGLIYLKQKKTDAARQSFQIAVDMAPDMLDARYMLAISLRDLGRKPEAIDHLQYIIAKKDSYASAHHAIGLLFAENPSTHPLARRAFLKYLELSPIGPTSQVPRDWLRDNP